jgi:hypothetical protein
MPSVQAPLKNANARSCESNTISGVSRGRRIRQHPAMTQPDMRHIHRHRRAVDQHDFMASVELIGLARSKAERNAGADGGRARARCHTGHTAAQRVAAFITEPAKGLDDTDQREPFAAGLGLVRRQHNTEYRRSIRSTMLCATGRGAMVMPSSPQRFRCHPRRCPYWAASVSGSPMRHCGGGIVPLTAKSPTIRSL